MRDVLSRRPKAGQAKFKSHRTKACGCPGRRHSTSAKIPLMAASPRNGFAVTALVLGIVGVVLALFSILLPVASLVVPPWGILAVIFGIVGRRRSMRSGGPARGMAATGIVLGAIAVALGIAGIVFVTQTSSEEIGWALGRIGG